MTTINLKEGDSISRALENAPEGPVTIILEKGIYKERVVVTRSDVTLISESGAVITNSVSHGDIIEGKEVNTGDSATFTVAAPNFSSYGVTYENSFDWISAVRWNEENEEEKKKDLQAVALRLDFGATNSSFRSCSFLSWQDTLYIDYGVSSFEDCTVEGAVDFIFGSGTALFQGCDIVSRARGFVTAPSTYSDETTGFVFHDCEIKRDEFVGDDTVYLARPWFPSGSENRSPMVLFIDSSLEGHIKKELWTDMATRNGNGEKIIHKAEDARFYITSPEYENISADKAEGILSSLIERLSR